MAVVSFEVPDAVAEALGLSSEMATSEVRLAASIFWYHRGDLSMGLAAEMAGMPIGEYLQLLADRGIDSVVVDIDDLKHDLSNRPPSGIELEAIQRDVTRALASRR